MVRQVFGNRRRGLSRRSSSATPGRMPSRCSASPDLLEEEGATVWRDGDQILGGQYYGEADRARDRPLAGRHADVLAAGVPVGQRPPGGAADLGLLPPPLSPRLAVADDRDPGAVPLLPGGLPVDRRPLAAAGALAAAIAQGVEALGVETKNPGGAPAIDAGPPAAATSPTAAVCGSAPETSRSGVRTGNWSGFWAKGVWRSLEGP